MVNMSEHKKVRKILSGLLSVAMMSIPLANFPVSADENTAITYVYDNYTDVSDYAGTYVTLRFCIYDAGDSIYDSIALIDEVKVA